MAIICTRCGRHLRAHISWDDVPNDAPYMDKAQFDASDSYWEGYYCPPGDSGSYEGTK